MSASKSSQASKASQALAKRAFDLAASAVGLLLLTPLLAGLSLWIALDSRGGVFFKQTRVGKNGKPFSLLKFRSMRPAAEARGQLTLGDRDPRITRAGHFLRKSKLDELPQLWNVFVGDMSLVGPRPEVPKYVAHYPPEFGIVLSVRPGITDAASIHFVDEAQLLAASPDPEQTYITEILPQKLALQKKYVETASFWGDLRLLFKTFAAIVR